MVLNRSGEPLHGPLAVGPLEVVRGALEQVRGEVAGLLADLPRGDRGGRAGDRRRPRCVGAEAIGCRVGVALLDLDLVRRDPQLLGHDLRVRGLVALALALDAEAQDRGAGGVHPQLGQIEHLDTDDVEVVGRPGPHDLGERADADAHELATGSLLGLLLAQIVVADRVQRLLERRVVVARVVVPARWRVVRELVLADEVLEPERRRVHVPGRGPLIHQALDGVDRLGHPE